MPTIRDICKRAIEINPTLDQQALRLLLLETLNLNNYSELNSKLDEEFKYEEKFWSYFAEFNKGWPVQYIVGKASFLGLDLYVDNNVLIPRIETEELVFEAIKVIREKFGDSPFSMIDIGTGSGAIAIAMARAFPNAKIYASDISEAALVVAKKNDGRFAANIMFLQGSALEPLIKNGIKVDVIISNPPYIINEQEIDPQVWKYEPHLALLAPAGDSVYQQILSQITHVIDDKALVFFEIGHDLEQHIKAISQRANAKCETTIRRDMHGKIRFAFIEVEVQK